jgi:hypothetical protein
MKSLFIVSISLFLFSCNHSTSDDKLAEGTFGIYLLQDSTITAGNAFSQSIDSLKLAPSAFLTVNDLKSYIWSTHAFELTDQAQTTFEQFRLAHGKTTGVPFVITVGNDRIYLGTFWWAYSSSMPPACAVIEVIAQPPYKIQLANGAIDKRSDSRIYNSLKKSGVLVE